MRGKVTREGAFELLDICYDLGGNFIDSASSYQSCESEEWLVQWFEKTGRRGEMVIATKYTMNSTMSLSRQESNFGGTEMEPMDDAVSDSSKRQDRVISISKEQATTPYLLTWGYADSRFIVLRLMFGTMQRACPSACSFQTASPIGEESPTSASARHLVG